MKMLALVTFLSILFLLVSCNRENKQTVKKSKIKELMKKSDLCACTDRELLSPPPPLYKIISTEKINLKSKIHSFFLTAKLTADQSVDFEGVDQQIFKIETKNKFRYQKFYFALPIKYNKYWNELKIYKSEMALNIGFEDKTDIYYLYKISLHKLEEANEGLVEIKSNFRKQPRNK